MDIKISKVDITLKNNKKISLTIEEAVELKQLLNRTFDKEDTCWLYPSNPGRALRSCPVYPWWPSINTVDPNIWNSTITLIDSVGGNWTVESSGDTLMPNCRKGSGP